MCCVAFVEFETFRIKRVEVSQCRVFGCFTQRMTPLLFGSMPSCYSSSPTVSSEQRFMMAQRSWRAEPFLWAVDPSFPFLSMWGGHSVDIDTCRKSGKIEWRFWQTVISQRNPAWLMPKRMVSNNMCCQMRCARKLLLGKHHFVASWQRPSASSVDALPVCMLTNQVNLPTPSSITLVSFFSKSQVLYVLEAGTMHCSEGYQIKKTPSKWKEASPPRNCSYLLRQSR